MNTRKLFKHSQLLVETLNQLAPRFDPNIPMIKKSVDNLIKKEYLKQAIDDIETLEYIG